MVNPVNGSGTQTNIANPFQQRQANNDDSQPGDAARAAKTDRTSSVRHDNGGQTGRSNQVAQSSGQDSKPRAKAGRGGLVDITV